MCCSFSRRLAKSTLLLIPLFGINYVVFVYLMEPTDKNMEHIKIFFELGLGSFQVTCDRPHFSPVKVHEVDFPSSSGSLLQSGWSTGVKRNVTWCLFLQKSLKLVLKSIVGLVCIWDSCPKSFIQDSSCHFQDDARSLTVVSVCVSGSNCRRPVLFPQQRGESTRTGSPTCLTLRIKSSTSQILNFPPSVCEKVQSELRRTWRGLSLKRYVGRDYKLHAMSVSRNGTENSAQFPRNSRAQSILQTETTMLWHSELKQRVKVSLKDSFIDISFAPAASLQEFLRWRTSGRTVCFTFFTVLFRFMNQCLLKSCRSTDWTLVPPFI